MLGDRRGEGGRRREKKGGGRGEDTRWGGRRRHTRVDRFVCCCPKRCGLFLYIIRGAGCFSENILEAFNGQGAAALPTR